MIYLKGCPRCHGDLYLDRDSNGPFRQCLQCGYIKDIILAPAVATRQAVPVHVRQTRVATMAAAPRKAQAVA